VGIETIHNFDKKIYGEQTMTGVLEKSINTGAVFVSKLVAPDVYLNYLDKFGFNEKTGIDLQGEVYSINKSLKSGREVNIATSSFGQGIEMTPMRLASSFCAFANGGKLVGPYIVEKIKDMQTEKNISRQPTDQVISQHTALQITNMLISVVDNGYSKAAKVPGYYVAGKTGTAQVPIENSAGYYEDRTIQSFIGYAPALNPQFLILIKLDNPKVSASSLSTPPIFGKLAKYILNYWQIPPDY
jgi:cell division protein FtsI/penicillin-binding protein 2